MGKDYGEDWGPGLNQGPWQGLDPRLGKVWYLAKARGRARDEVGARSRARVRAKARARVRARARVEARAMDRVFGLWAMGLECDKG